MFNSVQAEFWRRLLCDAVAIIPVKMCSLIFIATSFDRKHRLFVNVETFFSGLPSFKEDLSTRLSQSLWYMDWTSHEGSSSTLLRRLDTWGVLTPSQMKRTNMHMYILIVHLSTYKVVYYCILLRVFCFQIKFSATVFNERHSSSTKWWLFDVLPK